MRRFSETFWNQFHLVNFQREKWLVLNNPERDAKFWPVLFDRFSRLKP